MTDDETKTTAEDVKLVGLSLAYAIAYGPKRFAVNGRRLADVVRRGGRSVAVVERLLSSGS
jgi:hypothetical protein